MLDDHAHVMQVKLCKANTRGVTVVVLFHNGITEVLGLPKYVASTAKSRPRQVYKGMVLNRHRRDEHDQANLSTQEHLP